jgi:hypothetical protein
MVHERKWLNRSVGAGVLAAASAAAVIAALGTGALSTGASASSATSSAATHTHAVSHARPDAFASRNQAASPTAYPVTAFQQEFSSNLEYFCTGKPNPPCNGDGAANDYGTIDRVSSQFSNGGYGNYAPATKALVGKSMALVTGTGDENQKAGCPGTTSTSNPGETCTGPFALFGTGAAAGIENVFPKDGFTVTDDLYLSPTTAGPAGSLVDDDVELNASTGKYGIDNIITACAEPTSPGASTLGFTVNFGNGSPGPCTGTPVITTDGWYRFVFVFSNVDGKAYLTETVRDEPTAAVVATSGALAVGGTAKAITAWGGPGYFWLPSQDMSGLPLANFALQLGQVKDGQHP